MCLFLDFEFGWVEFYFFTKVTKDYYQPCYQNLFKYSFNNILKFLFSNKLI